MTGLIIDTDMISEDILHENCSIMFSYPHEYWYLYSHDKDYHCSILHDYYSIWMVYIMELNGLYMKYYDHYSTYMGIIPNFWGKPMPSAPSPQNHHFFSVGFFDHSQENGCFIQINDRISIWLFVTVCHGKIHRF